MPGGLHEIDLPPRQIETADQDAALLGTYRAASLIVAGSGAFGLMMSVFEPALTRRERAVAAAGAAAVVAGGLYGSRRPRVLAGLIRHRRAPPVIACGAITAIAGSSPQRSPMCFPSVILTAAAAVPLAARTSRRFGIGVGLAYLGVVGWSTRGRIRHDRQLWWNVGMSIGFPVAAVIGAAVGRLSIDVRLLERARQRDRGLIDQPDRAPRELDLLSAAAREIAAELDRVLLDAAQRDYGDATPAVRQSIERARSPTHHLELAPVLIAAARGERIKLVRDIASMLDTYRAQPLAAPIVVRFDSRLRAEDTYDARITAALLTCLKRALDNAALHGKGLSTVDVRLGSDAGSMIVLEVEDDGDGAPPPPSAWGTGLSEARRRCKDLGGDGDLILERGGRGVRLVARVPTVPLRVRSSEPASSQRTITSRTDSELARNLRDLKFANLVTGVTCLCCADRTRSAITCSAVFIALVMHDRHRPTVSSRGRWLTTALAGLIWPRGARPVTGWIGAHLIDAGIAERRVAWTPLVAAVASLAIQARRVRGTVGVGHVRGDLAFLPLCVAFAAVAVWCRDRLDEIERNTVSLREQAEYIESLVPAVQTFHDVVSPLKSSGAWLEHLDVATRQHLQRLSDKFNTPTAALRDGIMVPDPVADLQEHLAVRMSPITITVGGSQPWLRETREQERLLERARHFTDLIARADDITDRVLDEHPPDAFSRDRLARVQLHLEPDGPDWVILTVQPVLSRGRSRLRARARSAPRLEILSDSSQSHWVPADALARRED